VRIVRQSREDVGEEAGFGQVPHHTGLGVGFRCHEAPSWITRGIAEALEAGMAIVTEPGV
jgi:Xaa-Pro aminopeptidase